MKNFKNAAGIICLLAIFCACEKDEGKLPAISFKTGSGYVYHDDTIAIDSNFVIGIDAAKTENEDVLKKFNISVSKNGGAITTLLDQNLSGSDKDSYSPDYPTKLDSVAGQVTKYIFTVTNRDGLTNQVSLVLTGK